MERVKRSIYLPEKLRDDLKRIAEIKGLTQNALILTYLQKCVEKDKKLTED